MRIPSCLEYVINWGWGALKCFTWFCPCSIGRNTAFSNKSQLGTPRSPDHMPLQPHDDLKFIIRDHQDCAFLFAHSGPTLDKTRPLSSLIHIHSAAPACIKHRLRLPALHVSLRSTFESCDWPGERRESPSMDLWQPASFGSDMPHQGRSFGGRLQVKPKRAQTGHPF